MPESELVSIAAYVERYDRANRERVVMNYMQLFHLTRAEAERRYDRDRGDRIEAGIAAGQIDPTLK